LIVIRVAVNQDGYAYWNLSGPNSQTAADAQSGDDIVTAPDLEVMGRSSARGRRGRRLEVRSARPVLETAEARGLAVEVEVAPLGDASDARHTVTVRPRETPLVVDDETGVSTQLESFDLFATASIQTSPGPSARTQADIRDSILRLAGLYELGRGLPKQDAVIEVDDAVTIGLDSRYAPFRDGKVQGEERSMVAEVLSKAETGSVEFRCEVNIFGTDAKPRRFRVATDGIADRQDQRLARLEQDERRPRVVIGPLGSTPAVVRVEAVAEDRYGLRSPVSVLTANYRVIDARRWLEGATGLSLDTLHRQLHRLEADAAATPSDANLSAAAMLRALVDVLNGLDHTPAAPAAAVAGALRLADHVMPRISVSRR
jgi:hypothetical protein